MLAILLHRFESVDRNDPYNCDRSVLEQLIAVLGVDNYVNPGEFASLFCTDGWFITVDDGNETDLSLAEYLAGLNLSAVFFINPGLIGQPGSATINELKSIVELGHHVANHTFTHENLISLSKKEIFEQIILAKKWMEKNNFSELEFFAYPWGRNNFLIRRIVKKAGYPMAFGVTGRKFGKNSPKMCLPRFTISSSFDVAALETLMIRRNFSQFESLIRESFRIFQTLKARMKRDLAPNNF